MPLVRCHRRRYAPSSLHSRSHRSPPQPRRDGRGIARQGGFTLVELLTVAAVIAILVTITLGAVRGVKERAAIAQARSELAAIAAALEEFKRLYGDYPQLGEFGQAPATPTTTAGPGITTVQAKLFNCLTGVFGATRFGNADRLNGPNLLDVGKFTLNGTLNNMTFLVPASNAPNPPAKQEQNVCLVDPWGRRYLYYYKSAGNPAQWQVPGYVLFSAGPTVAANGNQTPPVAPGTGIFLATQTAEMADNIYATPP
jgi:prepilin-type N-terminal cleavage/methylation domain-containing protein